MLLVEYRRGKRRALGGWRWWTGGGHRKQLQCCSRHAAHKADGDSGNHLCHVYRHAEGNLVKEALEDHLDSPFFVVVRPKASAGLSTSLDDISNASDSADTATDPGSPSSHTLCYVPMQSPTRLQRTFSGSRSAASVADEAASGRPVRPQLSRLGSLSSILVHQCISIKAALVPECMLAPHSSVLRSSH